MSGKRKATRAVDYDVLDATTEDDIARQIAEDPDTAPDMARWTRTPSRVVRVTSGGAGDANSAEPKQNKHKNRSA